MYYYIIELVCFYTGKLFGNYTALSIDWDGFSYDIHGMGLEGIHDMLLYIAVCDRAAEIVIIIALLATLAYLLCYLAIGFYEGYTGKEIEEA